MYFYYVMFLYPEITKIQMKLSRAESFQHCSYELAGTATGERNEWTWLASANGWGGQENDPALAGE